MCGDGKARGEPSSLERIGGIIKVTRRTYSTPSQKRRDIFLGLFGWIVLNAIAWAAVWFGSPLLNPLFYQLLSGRDISDFYASIILSSLQLLLNVIALIFFAYTRRFLALGALIAISPILVITLCLQLFLGPTCFGTPAVAFLETTEPPTKGARIAYNSAQTQYAPPVELYVMNADGTRKTRLTYHSGAEPLWSPDGKQIAFRRQIKYPKTKLYLMNADGTHVMPFPDDVREFEHFAWSPDSRQIVFEQESDSSLIVRDTDGTGKARLARGSQPTWAPDGTQIAFVIGGSVYAIKPDGSGQIRLAVGCCPVWSPDSKRIAYLHTVESGSVITSSIMIMNADGTGQTRLTTGRDPIWSPDSKQIAFTLRDIYVVNADGTQLKPLANTWPLSAESLSWSPDGKKIAFSAGREVYVVNADGTGETRLGAGENPVWAPK